MDFLAHALRERGFKIRPRRGSAIDAYDPTTNEYVCGFLWVAATQTVPGHWTFNVNLSDVFALKDIKTALIEVTRLMGLRQKARDAWAAFNESKSDKRWSQYLSIVAALFVPRATSQDIPPQKEDSND